MAVEKLCNLVEGKDEQGQRQFRTSDIAGKAAKIVNECVVKSDSRLGGVDICRASGELQG